MIAHQIFPKLTGDAVAKGFCCDKVAVSVVGELLEPSIYFDLRVSKGRKSDDMLSGISEFFPVLYLHF